MAISNCEVSARCGGCPLISLTANEERDLKLSRLRETLVKHLGSSFAEHAIEWHDSDSNEGYRHRIRLRIDECGQLGFFNPQKTAECSILLAELRRGLVELEDLAKRAEGAFTELAHLELRAPDLDGKFAVYFTRKDPEKPVSPRLREIASEIRHRYIVGFDDAGSLVPCQRHALANLYHYVPINSFLQIHRAVNDAVVSYLVQESRRIGLSSFCDLYAGCGNFTLPLLATGQQGTAVEYDVQALRSCTRSALEQGLNEPQTIAGDATQIAEALEREGKRFDLVIVDPPRAGTKSTITTMAKLSKKALLYCSCNPETLAKDTAQLLPLGYRVEKIRAYNMFARTHHLETCLWILPPQT